LSCYHSGILSYPQKNWLQIKISSSGSSPLMGRLSYILYENHALYEQPIGRFGGDEMFAQVTHAQIAGKSPDAVKVRLTMQNGTDSLIEFTYLK